MPRERERDIEIHLLRGERSQYRCLARLQEVIRDRSLPACEGPEIVPSPACGGG